MFKDREDYLNQREVLINKAQGLYNEGKYEDSIKVKEEVDKLDNDFENFSKAQANINALKDSSKISNIAPLNKENKIGEVVGEDMTDSIEYRKAFMNHMLTGKPMAKEFKNQDQFTTTSNVDSVIPKTVMQRIIEKIEAQGMILPEITRTSFKGGLSIPISSARPVASWVGEREGSFKQNKATSSISFKWHKLRCAINMSLEVTVTTLDVFESTFVRQVAEAMIKALEQAIITGKGEAEHQPKGILHEDNLLEARDVAITDPKKTISYQDLVKAEGLLDVEYEAGAVWFMNKKTFMEIAGMVDSTGQPIGRINYGGHGARPEYSILGRRVVLNNYMPTENSTKLQSRRVVAFLVNAKDYFLNTNLEMTTKRYEDFETDDINVKSVMLVDGQLTQNYSLITISKKQA